MTTIEGVASLRRRGESSILSPKSVTDARPKRINELCH